VHRRALLGLPVLGAAAALLTGCEEDSDPVATDSTSPAARRHPYGDDPSQFGELTVPDGDARGVVVVIHGGFWRAAYDLDLGRPLAASLASSGWAAWNLEYRRVGNGGGAPATFDDVAAGIDALRDLDVDLGTVVTLGHSAGGHLATWAASRGRDPRWAGGVDVTHVVSQAGVVDLRAAAAAGLGDGAVPAFVGGPIEPVHDPLQQVPLDVPVWCVHGTEDVIVPISQSQSYVDAATGVGATAELVAVDGDHFVVIDPTSPAWDRTLQILDVL
jgi:acetyl esterase/lipase